MRTQVEYPSIFNTALPKVYIKRVSLVPTLEVGPKNGVSYDLEADDKLKTNKFGTKTPKQNKPRFADTGTKGKALAVNVELTIKDRIKDDGQATWYQNKEFGENLNIKVVLVKNRQVIENLEDGKFTPRNLKRLKKRGRIIEKIISIKKNETPITEQKIETIDGKNVYCTTFQVDFIIPNIRPRNMSIFAASIVDLREYYLNKYPGVKSSRRFLQGTTVSQRIIKAGDIITDANIYLLPNKKLWAGPIHYHEPTGYMVGAFHTPEPHEILERKKVPNLVIQDFRVIEQLKEADFLLRPQRKIRRKPLQNKRAQGNRTITKERFITEPEYAFNQFNEMRFVFHLDMNKIISEKSQFGAIYAQADQSAQRDIMQNSKIKNLSVFRHRVRPGLSKNDLIQSPAEDRTEIVAQSGDGNKNFLQPRRNIRPSNPTLEKSSKILAGGVREVRLDLPAKNGIRTFAISDFAFSKKTDGIFSYSVDFELEDGTIIFVNNQKKKLSQAIASLTKYYNTARQPENTNVITGLFTDDFIKETEAVYRIPELGEVNTPNRRRRRRVVQSSIAKAPWLNAVAVYADVMRNITNISPDIITRASFLLHSIVEPTSGTVDGIETLLELMNNLQNRLSLADLGGRNRSTSPLANTSVISVDETDFNAKTPAFKGKQTKTSIRLKRRFNTFHDSNIQNFVGYDFLDVKRSKNLGLRVLTTDKFEQRLLQESQKYFTINPNSVPRRIDEEQEDNVFLDDFSSLIDLRDAYYTYLTPAKVMFGKKTLKLTRRGKNLWKVKQYDSMISNIVLSTREKDSLSSKDDAVPQKPGRSIYSPSTAPIQYAAGYDPNRATISLDKYESNVANNILLNRYGVSITTTKTENAFTQSENISNGLVSEELEVVAAGNVMGENSNFLAEDLEPEDQSLETLDDTQIRDFSSVSSVFVKSSINSLQGDLSRNKAKKILDFRPSNENNIIEPLLEQYDEDDNPNSKKARLISKIPNQIKSIFLGDDVRANKNWFTVLENKGEDLISSPRYTGLCYFNYNHINQVEVLVGFETDRDGQPQISAPIYSLLNKQLFERIVNSGNHFICRMRPAKVPYFGKSRKLSLPEFNETFMLVSRSSPLDLRADAETVELQQEASEDFDFETVEESIFTNRLTEYEDLNTTGRKILRRLIRRNTRLSGIMPEFTSTAFVQQPRIISRTGARFGIETGQDAGQDASGVATQAVSGIQRTRAPRSTNGTPVRQTELPTNTAVSTTNRTDGSSMGGSGGGY